MPEEHKIVQQPKNPGIMRTGGGDGTLTVGDIRDAIAFIDDSVEVIFGSTMAGRTLLFYRFKWRGDHLLQMELNEAEDE